MRFQNYTPFPAIAWMTTDNQDHKYITSLVRVKYSFDTVDQNGFWSLKLDPDQGKLHGKAVYYDGEESSIRFENDNAPFKPHADFIVNAYAHSTVPLKEWRCGVKVLRPTENEELPFETLLEKWLRVKGIRYLKDDVVGFSFTSSKESTKIPVRYEYANGGTIPNPDYEDKKKGQKPYLKYSTYNPIGVGLAHKVLFNNETILRAPQIEAMSESLDKPNMTNPPQGFGFIERDWQPRLALAGTFDEQWIKEKHPVMPDDFQESFNNAAHPDLQYKKGYFEPQDKIVLHNLVKDRYEQSFQIPNFYFKSQIEEFLTSDPVYLNIDTIVVDILEDDMKKNAVYITYRNRIPSSESVKQASISMLVPKDFLGFQDG